MLMTDQSTDHFMVGEAVEVDGERGEISAVIEHTIEENGERKTHKRVLVDVGDREINAGSSEIEVVSR